MSPIRVGLVGLSKKTTLTNGWALSTHFPFLQASSHDEIVALCNSTVKSTKEAITKHKLGSNVKAYGSPEDLAKDSNVDLVIVSVNIAKHYQVAKPALMSGKDVYVEWPLGVNTSEAQELAGLAKAHGCKTIVGLQAFSDPLVHKLKEIIDNGKIGKVIATTVKGALPYVSTGMWPANLKTFFELDSGVSVYQVLYGHYLVAFTYALGPFTDLTSVFKTVYPTTNLVDATCSIVQPDFVKSSPDHVFIQGTLASSAIAAINFRGIDKNMDGTCVRWTITGSQGEIEIACPEMIAWQTQTSAIFKRYSGKSEVEDMDYEDPNEATYVASMAAPVPNTARSYEAFANGDKTKYATFEDGLELNRLLDLIVDKAQ